MTYGYCPICEAKGVSRERRINGNDKCENGHTYLSVISLKQPASIGDPVKEFAQKTMERVEELYAKGWNDNQVLMFLHSELERVAE